MYIVTSDPIHHNVQYGKKNSEFLLEIEVEATTTQQQPLSYKIPGKESHTLTVVTLTCK